jgi:tetratricopeptide (TPR) repeat protein
LEERTFHVFARLILTRNTFIKRSASSMATFEPKITRIESAPSVQSKIKAGRELAKQGKLDEASVELEGAVKLDPNSKIAHLALGTLKARQENLDDALREFKEVLRLDPMNMQAHLRAARVLISKKEWDKAEKYAESALRIDPKSPVAHVLLGHICFSRNDLARAKEHLLKALALNPRLVPGRIQMAAVLRNEGKTSEAMAQLNAAIRIEPDSPVAYQAVGKALLLQRDFGGAREAFEKALTLRPDDTRAKLGLAEALIESAELERAEEMLRRLPARIEGRSVLHKLWGDLYERRGLYPDAVEEYRAAQLIANQDIDTSSMVSEDSSLPAAEDLGAWQQLAAALKKQTDAYKEFRFQFAPVEVDD